MKTDLSKTPLMQLNPNLKENNEDPHRLLDMILRYTRPWEEKVKLPTPVDVVSETFGLDKNDPAVAMVLDNNIEEYTVSDFFEGGDPDVVLLRVITVANGTTLAKSLEGKPFTEKGLWSKELTYFTDSEPHIYVGDGHIYVSPNYPRKNLVLWDGANYRPIKHKENDFYVEEENFLLDGQPISFGGYQYQDRVQAEVDRLNYLKEKQWIGKLPPEIVVGKPHFLLQNVYEFIAECREDAIAMLNSLINKEQV